MRRLLVLLAALPASVGMCQGGHAPNVTPPQRLDVFMKPGPHWLQKCDHMGGVPISYNEFIERARRSTCRNFPKDA